MNKYRMDFYAIALGTFLTIVSSCSMFTSHEMLPNGVIIDQPTKERLINLESEYRALAALKISEVRQLDSESSVGEAWLDAAKELLTLEFGEEGLNYMNYDEHKESFLISGTDDEANSARWQTPIGDDPSYGYYMDCTAHRLNTPWNAYNWARTEVWRRHKSGGNSDWKAATIKTTIIDHNTSGNSKTGNLVRYVDSDGNANWGWFPSSPGGVKTTHEAWDGTIWTGKALKTLYWN